MRTPWNKTGDKLSGQNTQCVFIWIGMCMSLISLSKDIQILVHNLEHNDVP